MAKQMFCKKCGKTMDEANFYRTYNLEKYPNGHLDQCKKCITMHVNNWQPDTFLWILQECDVPYMPKEWTNLMAKQQVKDKTKLTGSTIIGRYLGKMRMNQYKNYRWKDTEFLKEKEQNEIMQAMRDQGYDQQEIDKAIEQTDFILPEGEIPKPTTYDQPLSAGMPQEQSDFVFDEPEEDLGLTEEEKLAMRLKWGKGYKQEEWVKLEQLYNDMMQSYDIQTAGHIDTLKFICKTSLKMNQLIDIGDVEGFQKMSKVYDSLMKSGKFTAAQNKAESGEFVDSVGELIALAEKYGYIETFYVDKPNDKVDITIKDMQRYTRRLIEEETNLNELIEAAIERNNREDTQKNEAEDIVDFDDLNMEDLENQITTDKDFEEFNQFQAEEMNEDALKLFKDNN